MKRTITVCRIGFVHPNGLMDETEFDTDNDAEALDLFKDFCEENHFENVKIDYMEYGSEEIED